MSDDLTIEKLESLNIGNRLDLIQNQFETKKIDLEVLMHRCLELGMEYQKQVTEPAQDG